MGKIYQGPDKRLQELEARLRAKGLEEAEIHRRLEKAIELQQAARPDLTEPQQRRAKRFIEG